MEFLDPQGEENSPVRRRGQKGKAGAAKSRLGRLPFARSALHFRVTPVPCSDFPDPRFWIVSGLPTIRELSHRGAGGVNSCRRVSFGGGDSSRCGGQRRCPGASGFSLPPPP